jgi:hypothetical protein
MTQGCRLPPRICANTSVLQCLYSLVEGALHTPVSCAQLQLRNLYSNTFLTVFRYQVTDTN